MDSMKLATAAVLVLAGSVGLQLLGQADENLEVRQVLADTLPLAQDVPVQRFQEKVADVLTSHHVSVRPQDVQVERDPGSGRVSVEVSYVRTLHVLWMDFDRTLVARRSATDLNV